MKFSDARRYLFLIWAVGFLLYVVLTICTKFKPGVSFNDASNATWRIAYILIPVLTAFASFTLRTKSAQQDRKLPAGAAYVIFTLTAMFHGFLLFYFLLAISFESFNWPDDPADSFEGRFEWFVRFVFLFSTIGLAPLGFLLGGREPALGSMPSSTEQSDKTTPQRKRRRPDNADEKQANAHPHLEK